MIYGIIAVLFFIGMLLYFRIADYYNIVDHPNDRSSHSEVTIRGGGIIFLFAALATVIIHPDYWLPVVALFSIGVISFVDDRINLSSRLRILIHLFSVSLFFFYLNAFSLPAYEYLLLYFVVIGTINAYNFMDGINGITGTYSLVVLAGLQYVNSYQVPFVQKDIIWLPMLACAVFLYFNFRKKARCFAGDVGSVTIALWIVMLLIQLILLTNDWKYILFLAIYGTDSVITIIHRIILKQNVFQPHRLHLYQIMVNEKKFPHLVVSLIYAFLQAVIIFIVINDRSITSIGLVAIILVPLSVIYILLKTVFMQER
ncbi:MAG TPA: glycosyltransferase family 4 protein [Mucilaginibacter sp.]|jgi:UDP-N-acetylmuramyl pentapeptide phosphotransferase/UDP-N-acetylglucosamine-1-phosphate transferase|nr:glycosyltransferase family 4 protein [Mucilaginibacter sp.]